MSTEVRRAHSMDIAICEDHGCAMLHIIMCDQNDDVFAELVVDPNYEWLSDFVNVLIELTLTVRLRQRVTEARVMN